MVRNKEGTEFGMPRLKLVSMFMDWVIHARHTLNLGLTVNLHPGPVVTPMLSMHQIKLSH